MQATGRLGLAEEEMTFTRPPFLFWLQREFNSGGQVTSNETIERLAVHMEVERVYYWICIHIWQVRAFFLARYYTGIGSFL